MRLAKSDRQRFIIVVNLVLVITGKYFWELASVENDKTIET